MAFTKALFYPWIDIKDEGWLKNAMLYWESIQTIVPASIEQPYSTRTAREFHGEGMMTPLHVESSMREIEDLRGDVIKYLQSPEGAEVLLAREIPDYHYIHTDKLPKEITRLVDIHPDKLPIEIMHKIEMGNRNGWLSVDSRFANFYMTLLATRLSEQRGSGLLTETLSSSKLATAARLDVSLYLPKPKRDRYEYEHRRQMPVSLAQGTLADLIFERIQIDPDTSVAKIIRFRRDHSDELGRLRHKIGELTKSVSTDIPLDALRQQLEDLYLNEVKPAVNALSRGLKDSRIKWITENFLKVTCFSTGSTSVPLAMLGLSVPNALLVGAGVSLTASAILYNREKQDTLRQNPFSYFLAAERAFC